MLQPIRIRKAHTAARHEEIIARYFRCLFAY
jgi:hypothetical protein